MRYLEVGQIVKTHGIKGELKVKILTDNLSRFDKGSVLYVGEDKKEVTITSSRVHQGMILITINELYDINKVLDYVNKMMYVDIDSVEDDEDGYYYDDLIGCDVFVNDEKIGVVNDIIEVPQGELLEIDINGEMKLVPYVDEFISSVDIDNKKIVITPIEGLL